MSSQPGSCLKTEAALRRLFDARLTKQARGLEVSGSCPFSRPVGDGCICQEGGGLDDDAREGKAREWARAQVLFSPAGVGESGGIVSVVGPGIFKMFRPMDGLLKALPSSLTKQETLVFTAHTWLTESAPSVIYPALSHLPTKCVCLPSCLPPSLTRASQVRPFTASQLLVHTCVFLEARGCARAVLQCVPRRAPLHVCVGVDGWERSCTCA